MLSALALVACGDDNPSSSCPDKPYPPSFRVRTFNADTIELEIPLAVDCPGETIDTAHVAARLEGHVVSEDGSVDSIWFKYITPGWIMAANRPRAFLWATPRDGIVHLRGVKLNVTAATKESGDFVTFEARQDPATY